MLLLRGIASKTLSSWRAPKGQSVSKAWNQPFCGLSTLSGKHAVGMLHGNEEYRRFVDALLKTKVSEYISLPTIASMGDTSSGKTSVLSSLTNIELPSSDQLTTRCPIMLQMRNSKSRTAKVTVAWKEPTSENPSFEPLLADESNWDELKSMIELAQQFVIETTEKEVSRDVVSVELEGPECVNLTVVDLPGIVRTSGKGESAMLAELTQSLIAEYMANPRCIILAIHPANVDFHNSSIMADAKKLDPQTKRTFPVLTKPDLIDSGAEENVKKLLLGEKTEYFEQGFHMIKSRGQSALDSGQSIDEGLQNERTFFDTTEPWSNITNRDLFGIPNLRRKLGDVQVKMAQETFPDVVKELKDQRASAETELAKIGTHFETLAEMRVFYTESCERITRVLEALLSGRNTRVIDFDAHLPSARFHDKCFTYREKLAKGRIYSLSGPPEESKVEIQYQGIDVSGRIVHDESGNAFFDVAHCGNDEAVEKHFLIRDAGYATSSVPLGVVFALDDYGPHVSIDSEKKREMVPTVDRYGIKRESNTNFDILKGAAQQVLAKREAAQTWLGRMIKNNRSYTVPVFTNDEIFERIVGNLLDEDWLEPSLDVVDGIASMTKDAVVEVLKHDANAIAFPRLGSLLHGHMNEVVDDIVATARQEVERFVQREKVPYTQNHYLNETLSSLRVERMLHFAKKVLTDISGHHNPMDNESVKKALDDAASQVKKPSIEEYMEAEMKDALKAYGKVAYKRFIDCVPMICGDAMLGCPDRIRHALAKVSEDDIEKALSLTPSDLQRRKDLKSKIDELDKGLKILRDLN